MVSNIEDPFSKGWRYENMKTYPLEEWLVWLWLLYTALQKIETPNANSKAFPSSATPGKPDTDCDNASLNNAHNNKHPGATNPQPPTSAKSLSSTKSGKQKSGFCILTWQQPVRPSIAQLAWPGLA